MTKIVPAEQIEQIVGCPRHPRLHLARAVSDEQTVYILHSQLCLGIHHDLRNCLYSRALDRGIALEVWSGFQDKPVVVWIADAGKLEPDSLTTHRAVQEHLARGGRRDA